jgi:hypothetical protein
MTSVEKTFPLQKSYATASTFNANSKLQPHLENGISEFVKSTLWAPLQAFSLYTTITHKHSKEASLPIASHYYAPMSSHSCELHCKVFDLFREFSSSSWCTSIYIYICICIWTSIYIDIHNRIRSALLRCRFLRSFLLICFKCVCKISFLLRSASICSSRVHFWDKFNRKTSDFRFQLRLCSLSTDTRRVVIFE